MSELGLIHHRVEVEVEYFLALVAMPLPQLADFPADTVEAFREVYRNFSTEDAQWIKDKERVTNHDVKAVEYFVKEAMETLGVGAWKEFVHFGLTSQDVNNTAVPLSLKRATEQALLPLLDDTIADLARLALEWKDVPMLARTHGQAASPVTLGKEFQVFVDRLRGQRDALANATYDQLSSIAVGTPCRGLVCSGGSVCPLDGVSDAQLIMLGIPARPSCDWDALGQCAWSHTLLSHVYSTERREVRGSLRTCLRMGGDAQRPSGRGSLGGGMFDLARGTAATLGSWVSLAFAYHACAAVCDAHELAEVLVGAGPSVAYVSIDWPLSTRSCEGDADADVDARAGCSPLQRDDVPAGTSHPLPHPHRCKYHYVTTDRGPHLRTTTGWTNDPGPPPVDLVVLHA